MSRWTLSLAVGAALLVAVAPAPTHAQATVKAIERLQKVKADRAKLIEQQNATLQRLDALEKEAQQLRVFARRT